MKNCKCVWLFVVVSILIPGFVYADGPAFKNETVRMCGGEHEWPPYYYYKRVDGKKTKEIVGFDIDLFNMILTERGIKYTAKLLPWKRSLKLGMMGEKYDVVFGGGLNDQRRRDYVTTEGYYSVTPTYFYAKAAFPGGFRPESASEIKGDGRKLCGLQGFNYVNFGQNNADIEMESKDYNSLVGKTAVKRCDVSFVRYEILAGWGELLYKDFVGNDKLVFAPVPGVSPESFHLMISKNWKYAEDFKKYFDNAVAELKASGELKKLLDKHVKASLAK